MPKNHVCHTEYAYDVRMEIRHLETLISVAAAGSISAAAIDLRTSQPALSRHIAELERRAGVPLLLRTARGVELTPPGRALRDHALGILGQIDKIPELVRKANTQPQLLRVGMPPGMPHSWFRSSVKIFRGEQPSINFALTEANSNEQWALLQADFIDLALLHNEPREHESRMVLRQEIGVALAPDSELQAETTISLSQLDGKVVMAHESGEVRRQEARLRIASESAGIHVHWVFRKFAQHSVLIAGLADADAVLTTAPSARINFPGWTWRPMENTKTPGQDLTVQTWASWKPSTPPVTAGFVKILAETGSPWLVHGADPHVDDQ